MKNSMIAAGALAFLYMSAPSSLAADKVTCSVSMTATAGDSTMFSLRSFPAPALDTTIDLRNPMQQGIADSTTKVRLEKLKGQDDPILVTSSGKGSKGLDVEVRTMAIDKASRADLYRGPDGATNVYLTLWIGDKTLSTTATVPDGGTVETSLPFDDPGYLGGWISSGYKLTGATLKCTATQTPPLAPRLSEAFEEELRREPKLLTSASLEEMRKEIAPYLKTLHARSAQ